MIAIYARQSVDKKDSISIESQVDFCKREVYEEEYKIYIDKGYSGKNTERPKFQDMIQDIRDGLISKVIVYKLDRISRNLLDFTSIMEVFKKHNVDFSSCNEKFDTSTPMGNAMLNITMVFAQLERETIQKRIKDNYYARGAKGFYMGGRAPYGFNKVETKVEGKKTYTFENNPEQIPFLIKMYDLYANTDMSLGKVSDYLNKNNIPSAEGVSWDSGKVSRILRSPVYVKADAEIYSYYKNKGCNISNKISDFVGVNGCYLYGKRESNERKYTKVENHVLSIGLHEGVIDSHTWLLCQYKLDSNKQIKNSGKGKHSWLSGIIKCGYCGYAVSVVKGRKDLKYFYCRGKTNLKICNGHSKPIYVEEVEKIVENYLLLKVDELRNSNLKTHEGEDAELNKIKLQILDIDNQIENLVNQMAQANNVVMKYINDKLTQLDKAKNLLVEEMKKVTIVNSKTLPMDEVIQYIDKWDNLSIEEKKDVCSYFIDKVYLKDDEVKINWK